MKCKCGKDIDLKIAAKVKGEGCRILTAITTIVTVQCEGCGEVFQVPLSVKDFISKEK